MFGTWKYDPETDEVQSVRNGFDPVTARSSSHQACDRCHEKKLRCSGDKNGCERCRSNGLRCEYTRSGSKSSKKKSPRKSNDGDSPSSSSSRRGGSSSKRSSKHTRIVTSGEETGGVLSQFDFSQLSPEDGFDLNLLSGADPSAGGYATAGPSGDQYSMQAYDTNYQQWDAGYSQYSQGYSTEAWGEYDQSAYTHDPRYYHSGR
ncbi:transcription factor [Fusarium austroafricanum]|uniref:Transcription factor n=1 Tax=Fusarium austroafricanum TaxID=2364996 RepID=A0A8H4KTI3_9HYPO|nr:transcription factor [Fusarium austroafricanum]